MKLPKSLGSFAVLLNYTVFPGVDTAEFLYIRVAQRHMRLRCTLATVSASAVDQYQRIFVWKLRFGSLRYLVIGN